MANTKTRAQKNREIRQKAIREQLASQQHITHIIKICEELDDLSNEMDAIEVTRKRAVIDTKLKLVNKYLPDLKQMALTGEEGGAIQVTEVTRTIING